MQGLVHSTESFGSADGPGVRFVVFLQGCPMRCRYCHNPDTWALDRGTPMDVVDLLDRAERYRSYWGADGGITVSGGEALLQPEFVAGLLEGAHARGINTCLDTSLAPFTLSQPFYQAWERVMAACDLVLADIKHIDPIGHQRLTGHGNENILEGLRWLSDHKIPTWIRHVLVPGITDTEEYLERTRDFIQTLDNVRRIEVLPYHTLGIFKWDELGLTYTLRDTEPPTPERVEYALHILRAPKGAQAK